MKYYTEYPTGHFYADSDDVALVKTSAKVLYRESGKTNEPTLVLLRDLFDDTRVQD